MREAYVGQVFAQGTAEQLISAWWYLGPQLEDGKAGRCPLMASSFMYLAPA